MGARARLIQPTPRIGNAHRRMGLTAAVRLWISSVLDCQAAAEPSLLLSHSDHPGGFTCTDAPNSHGADSRASPVSSASLQRSRLLSEQPPPGALTGTT